MSALRVGVVGVGHIGRHHARILAGLPDVKLVGVVDADPEAAHAVATQYGASPFTKTAELADKVDAVTIAVPTIYHYPAACEFLRRGIATLVEKPLAFSTNEAREMARLAKENGAILQVGHVERFNPAWADVEGKIDMPIFVEAQRFSEYPFRSIDVSVVFDLMIHDLDLVLQMVASPVAEVEAVGCAVLSPTVDAAEARLRFENGAFAVISANRVHDRPVRRIRFWGRTQSGEVDLFRRTTLVRSVEGKLPEQLPTNMQPDEKSKLLSQLFRSETATLDRAEEPLRNELQDFVDAVRLGRVPKVTGEHGCELVSLATRIETAIRQHHTVELKVLRKSA